MTAKIEIWAIWILIASLAFSTVSSKKDNGHRPSKFPYQRAGLTDAQAAAHLLSRFSYGAKKGQIQEVISLTPERWFALQLEGSFPDDTLMKMLGHYNTLQLSNSQIARLYPRNGQILQMAVKEGVINKDSVSMTDKKAYKVRIADYMKSNGYQPQKELIRQLVNQKVLRATYSNNQLHEVLTEFWFNHFNVSLTKNQCAQFVLGYERDVIRPNVTAKFGTLLLATAQSPAMLYYLDNFSSSAAGPAKTSNSTGIPKPIRKKKMGLNENYAREVMELHTLGVDGGYIQRDVTEAARLLTGWTVYPVGVNAYGKAVQRQINLINDKDFTGKGLVQKDDFLFLPNRHDTGEKSVLGKKFKEGGGYQEGVELLDMLAHHPATARFICKKLAVRFVSDAPPQSLIDEMVKTFLASDGSIAAVLNTMVYPPEFWDKNAVREKTKSPFELAISTVRGLDAEVRQPYQLYNWVNRMGQNIYHYQAPTGFPDNAHYWINTGALLNRMNFGLAIAGGKVAGIIVDLAHLNHHHEPESAEKALTTYGNLIMPERNLSQTVKMLTPLLNDPDLAMKVNNAASKVDTVKVKDVSMTVKSLNEKDMLAQVVGILVGSPEFQRR